MASVNIGAVLQYGSSNGIIRKASLRRASIGAEPKRMPSAVQISPRTPREMMASTGLWW